MDLFEALMLIDHFERIQTHPKRRSTSSGPKLKPSLLSMKPPAGGKAKRGAQKAKDADAREKLDADRDELREALQASSKVRPSSRVFWASEADLVSVCPRCSPSSRRKRSPPSLRREETRSPSRWTRSSTSSAQHEAVLPVG